MVKIKCSVMDCTKEAIAKGKCQKHYYEARRNDPKLPRCSNCNRAATARGFCDACYYVSRRPVGFQSTAGRCMRFLETIPETDECVLWPFSLDRLGYGNMHTKTTRTAKAHAVSLMIRVPKPFPEAHALHASHEVCGNRHCVNPNHLRWGTRGENMADRIIDGTSAKRLNPDKVRKIRAMRAEGKTNQSIADVIGVSRSSVADVLFLRTWTNVT